MSAFIALLERRAALRRRIVFATPESIAATHATPNPATRTTIIAESICPLATVHNDTQIQGEPEVVRGHCTPGKQPTLKLVDVCDTPFTFSSKPIRKMNVVVNRDRCWILYVGDAVPHGLNIACRT